MNKKLNLTLGLAVVAIVIAILGYSQASQMQAPRAGSTLGTGDTLSNVTHLDALTLDSGNLTLTSGNVSVTGSLTSSGAATVGTFTQGGGIRATSTTGTVVPLIASDFDTENVIDVTLNTSSGTLSFPATTTLASFIPTAGQTRTLFIRNATTTAATTLTITGGTGVLLKNASSTSPTGIILGDTDGANYGKVELLRKANTDIEALLTIFQD